MHKRFLDNFRRFQLSFWIGCAIVGFLLSLVGILWLLGATSVAKARAVRSEFVERDLRELVGRFDSDERYVLEHNLDQLVAGFRPVRPLLLPRQYYVGLPANYLRIVPRQPPRNCFVELDPLNKNTTKQAVSDKICSYFSENRSAGSYLFLAADISDNFIVPLKMGDISLTADALQITVEHAAHSATWWLALQAPKERSTQSRFEITAIRENPNGTRERDKRIEGWAYVQSQSDGSQLLRFIVRLDFNEFLNKPRGITAEHWPPANWNNTVLRFARKDVSASNGVSHLINYQPVARTQLSLASLADSIFDSYAELTVQQTSSSGLSISKVVTPATQRIKIWGGADNYFRVINDDLVIASSKVTLDRILPDTNLRFIVRHPGVIIERVVWQSFLALFAFFVVGMIFAWYFYRNLLKPVFTLTRRIRYLVNEPTSSDHELPYSNQKNELGTLARGFNELLSETRHRVQREVEEQRSRQAIEERQRKETIQAREENLKLIGHEIRSPLQALISLHNADSKSRPYLDRIHKALEYLQGTLSAQKAISERELEMKDADISQFLEIVAQRAPLAKIDRVIYCGPKLELYCRFDIESLEDCIENILKNADRFRRPDTPIHLGLSCDEGCAVITISNQGTLIPEENIDRIFDYGMTTTPNQKDAGNGIGLYVARQYLLLMHANIYARNLEDGVCFEIRLPLCSHKKSQVSIKKDVELA